MELRAGGAEEGHRGNLGEDGAPARAAVRRVEPLGARLALVPARLWIRPGGRHGGYSLRRVSDQGAGQTEMVGWVRSAGALRGAEHGDAERDHHHQGGARLAQGARREMDGRAAARASRVCGELVPALPGTGGQVQAGPLVLRRYGAAAGTGRPGYRGALDRKST